MTSFRIRPRFRHLTEKSCTDIKNLLLAHGAEANGECVVSIRHDHILISIRPEFLHFWSPQLDITCEATEAGTEIRGLYGPDPHVWTLFLFGYGAIAILATFAAIVGITLYSLDMPAWILWSLPAIAALALGMYIASQLGQKLGAAQTFELHHFLEKTLGEKIGM